MYLYCKFLRLKKWTIIITTFYCGIYLIAHPTETTIAFHKAIFSKEEKIIFYKLGDIIIPIKIIQFGKITGIVCINLHDNETTSVDAAISVLDETGGTLIKIENNQQRLIRFRLKGISYSFDPNSIFSRTGIEKSLKENSSINREAIIEVEKFAKRILQLFEANTSCIIALHNNTEGSYSIRTYLPGNEKEMDAKEVYYNQLQDIDDLVLTTDSILYQKMADNGFNSIWQENTKAVRDGSLSVYCGERNKRYINIETQHGKLAQYVQMLQKLISILKEENKEIPEKSGYSP